MTCEFYIVFKKTRYGFPEVARFTKRKPKSVTNTLCAKICLEVPRNMFEMPIVPVQVSPEKLFPAQIKAS